MLQQPSATVFGLFTHLLLLKKGMPSYVLIQFVLLHAEHCCVKAVTRPTSALSERDQVIAR